jgi:hypothetical protein
MLKKLLLASVLSLGLASSAFASNVPYFPGSTVFEPGQALANANSVIGRVNQFSMGLVAANLASSVTSGTSIYSLFATTLAGFSLPAVGEVVRVHAWGTNSADANVKTVTLSYGASTNALVVTGSGATWDVWFDVIQTGAATQILEGHGQTGTTVIASVQGTGTVSNTAPIALSISGTAATSGTITLVGATVEIVQ